MKASSLIPHTRSIIIAAGVADDCSDADDIAEFLCELALELRGDLQGYKERVLEADPDFSIATAGAVYEKVENLLKAKSSISAPEAKAVSRKRAFEGDGSGVRPAPAVRGVEKKTTNFAAFAAERLHSIPNTEQQYDFDTPHLGCHGYRIALGEAPELPSYYTIHADTTGADLPDLNPDAKEGGKDLKEMLRLAAKTLEAARRGPQQGPQAVDDREQNGRKQQKNHSRVVLPIASMAKEIMREVMSGRVIIVEGETGSGKTTQIPQILVENGFQSVVVTQPRRVAVVSAARRVAAEMRCRLGTDVGYTIRHENVTSPATRIRFVTDGILCQELTHAIQGSLKGQEREGSPPLLPYDAVMMDEVHERSLNTDLLLSLFRNFVLSRARNVLSPHAKLIVTSATLNKARLSAYFTIDNAVPRALAVPGKVYPVENLYAKETPQDFLEEAVQSAYDVCVQCTAGRSLSNVLVFLLGQDDVQLAAMRLTERLAADKSHLAKQWRVHALFGAQTVQKQMQIFDDRDPQVCGYASVIFSTNIAETSVTVPNVGHVIDCGMEKRKILDHISGVESLEPRCISQKSATQRAGRAGRTQAGVVYRLYTAQCFAAMDVDPAPEILRLDIAKFTLMLKAVGVDPLDATFEMLDTPDSTTVQRALLRCHAMRLLDHNGTITPAGRRIASLPLAPNEAVPLLHAAHQGDLRVVRAVACIAAILGTQRQTVFLPRRTEHKTGGDVPPRFADPSGDHMSLCNAYERWEEEGGGGVSWCAREGLCHRTLMDVRDVARQLCGLVKRDMPEASVAAGGRRAGVLQAFLMGGMERVAVLSVQDGGSGGGGCDHTPAPRRGASTPRPYTALRTAAAVYVHPASSLHDASCGTAAPHAVLFTTVTHGTRDWMACVSKVSPQWILDLPGGRFKRTDVDGVALGHIVG